MTEEQKAKCHKIIHTAAVTAATIGAGLAQIPCADNVAISAIQVTAVISLGSIFGMNLQQTAAESALGSKTATMLGRSISQVFVGWMPLVGNVSNALTAGVISEVTLWAIASDFSHRSTTCHQKKERKNADNKRST